MLDQSARTNPLDALMTKAQIVRKQFKAQLPRKIQNRILSKLEAMARTMELIDKFRSGMKEAGLRPDDVAAALVHHRPERTPKDWAYNWLPAPEKIREFIDAIMVLDKETVFLGLLFYQRDREAKPEKQHTAFLWPFMGGPEAERHMLEARKFFVKGGHKVLDN